MNRLALILSLLLLSACADRGMYQAPVLDGYHRKQYAEPQKPLPTPPVISEDVTADELPPQPKKEPITLKQPEPQKLAVVAAAKTTKTESKTEQYLHEHKVKAGEYIYALARQYKVKPEDIIVANKLKAPFKTEPGQILLIPQTRVVKAEVSALGGVAGPIFHTVEKNETLYRIGLKYSVSPLDIMAANNIEKPEALVAGSKLRIPVAGVVEPEAEEFKPYIDEKAAKQPGYVWPVKGKIITAFGQQQTGIFNSGIAIAVAENTPVLAIDDAQVIYADEGLKHYGKMVLLRHGKGLVSAYGHNNKLFVKKGDRIRKGQVIALSGDTGNATEPQLHLEVRKNAKAINPTSLLPKN